jgi:hypothetical protein
MIRKICVLALIGILTHALVLSMNTNGYCIFNLPGSQKIVVFNSEDHRVLRHFFSNVALDKSKKILNDKAREVLLRSSPDLWKSELGGSKNDSTSKTGGLAHIAVRVIYVEEVQAGKPQLALLALSCDEREPTLPCEDRLIGLKVEKETSTIVSIEVNKDCDSCSDTTRIVLEKQVRISGLTVIGVNFITSYETGNTGQAPDLVRQERVQFFVFDGDEIREAGSIIKSRVETVTDRGKGDVTINYNAGIVFKKDMKGNIIGILSPFTKKTSNGGAEKGMIRFVWNPNQKIFVRE